MTKAAEDRCKGEDGDRGREHGAGAEPIGDPAACRNENRKGQHIGGHSDIEIDRVNPERSRHLRQRGHDDGAVEVFHEKGAGDEQCDRRAARKQSSHKLSFSYGVYLWRVDAREQCLSCFELRARMAGDTKPLFLAKRRAR